MRILAIDPGTEQSGVVLLDDGRIVFARILSNLDVRWVVKDTDARLLAIEMIASYGMPVGKEVFETCVWIGRFVELWTMYAVHGVVSPLLIPRKDVKMHLCGTPKAKDGNIRQALIDKLGPQGTKKAPGATYGVKSHTWAALGVAVTAAGI